MKSPHESWSAIAIAIPFPLKPFPLRPFPYPLMMMFPALRIRMLRPLFLAVLLPVLLPAPWLQAMTPEGRAGVVEEVDLNEIIEGEHFWGFHDGREFPGATGAVKVVGDQPEPGKSALEVSGDFSKGGLYVAAIRNLKEFGFRDIREIRLKIKADGLDTIGVRLGDGSGQTHQKKNVKIQADGQWHDLVITPSGIAGGEHWGGANDGQWHGSPQYVSINLGKPSGERKKVSLWIAEAKAIAIMDAKTGGAAWSVSFAEGLPEGWKATGRVTVDSADTLNGTPSLVLEKTAQSLREEVSVTSESFPVTPGPWQIGFAARSDLESMDNSYQGHLALEFLDRQGRRIDGADLATLFRKNPWKPEKKQVEAPDGAVRARFVATIRKETPGKFWISGLSAVPLVADRKDDTLRRMMFGTARLGNLIYPEDSRAVTMEVWSSRPLSGEQRRFRLVVTDYWGAEQSAPLEGTLQRDGKKDALFRYTASVDLRSVPMEIGRYYEIHGSISRKDAEPFTGHTSLAILPEAPANGYKPEEIPWTSRNWDNRLPEYVHLTHRLGIRICGIWGKMEADPAKVEAPRLDLVEKLGMGFLTGSPAHQVEARSEGWQELLANDGEKLRQGVRNFLKKYGHVKPMIVNLGNEPHNKGEEVKANVEAYRIVYEELKKNDPSIFVVGTSVGPRSDSDFAKYGYGKWCDAYDFHVYEDARSVRRFVSREYPAMFRKFGEAKPVWSTELGLNSQGMARQFVAAELYRKTVNFFAGGGANMSWFGLLYPDPQGRNHDSFASAHNVFDCRFNRYAPKLDAIAYYNAVNAIGIKKYVGDKTYENNTHAFLFRDRNAEALQLWYNDKGKEDLFIPLPGVRSVRVIRIDGSLSDLDAEGRGVTLTVAEDPVLLLYTGTADLPETREPSRIRLASASDPVIRGEESHLDILCGDEPVENLELKAPPFWSVKKSARQDAEGKAVARFILRAPEESTVREADMTILIKGRDGKPRGELSHRPHVMGTLSLELLPVPVKEGEKPAVKLVVSNHGPAGASVNWEVEIRGEQSLREGVFSKPEPSSAYFADAASGVMELEGKTSGERILPLAEADLYKVYRMRAVVRDASGRATAQERMTAAFYGVPRAKRPPTIDGRLDDEDWKRAPARALDQKDQFFAFVQKDKPTQDWTGADDLSAEIRYLWDDQYLYVSVKVKDDVAGKILHADGGLWKQDGLQFLVDPMRTSERKVGKYEYSIGEGTRGAQVWCTLSADGAAPAGNAPEVKVAIHREGREGSGDATYEIAIPWQRLAPFKPEAGGNLGFTLIVNEDDGHGRDAFMTWFGNAHSKDIDTVGDLILLK